MAAIGSLVFCTDCGNLLSATKGKEKNSLSCDCCGAWNKDTGAKATVSRTKPSDFPSQLRQRLQSSVQAVERRKLNTQNTSSETCPACGREEVKYTEVQMRSADEGSTVIYTCDCGNSWQENN